ncbi:MAG: GNAT family N-acetyltransferase [Methanomassiliicoccales archaeon]|nr:GNAT family N-acetyltransferase [Methanomassiliicoccales archaeon]
MSELTIRRMTEADYDAVTDVWNASGLPVRPKGRDSKERVLRQIGEEGAFYLVAESEGDVIGVLLTTHDTRKGWLNRLAVRPEWRGRGVATALVHRAEDELRAMDIRVYSVLIHADNSASRHLFNELGYKEHDDIVYLSKRLEDDD